MKKNYILSLVAFMLLAVNYVSAQTTIYPSMDTFIHQQTANAGVAQNSNNPNVLEVRSSGSLARITFMDIPVSSISSFSGVSSAILNLYLQTAATSTDNVDVYQVTAQGVTIDNSTTWNSLYPSGTETYTLGSSLGTITVTNGNAVNTKYSFNITSLISALAPGTQKVTLCLKATTTAGPKDFWSVDYATIAYRPALVVTTVASSVPVTGVTLNPTTKSVTSGATTTLTATVAPTDATNKSVTWSSSNDAVATVSASGVVTGVSVGNATITATTVDGSKTATCEVTVTAALASTNYVLNPGFELDNAAVQTPMNWSEWSPNTPSSVDKGSVVSGDAHSGSYYGKMTGTAAYSTMTFQSISNLPSGVYTLKGWFRSSGGQGWANMSIKNYGGSEIYAAINGTMGTWTQKTISNINITTGVCEIDIYNDAQANQWVDYDDIELTSNGVSTAITLVANSNYISIYPTVIANNVLNISNSVKGNYEVSISNLNGQSMYTNKHNSGNVSINTSFLKTGMYLVRVSNGIDNRVQKVIVP